MPVQNLYQPFEIEFIKANECPIKAHQHTFFELVYILSGAGIYTVNQNKFHYTADNIFLIMPLDNHYTEVKSTTSFLFVRFNNVYLKAQEAKAHYSNLGDWTQKLEFIFQSSNYLQGNVLKSENDKLLARTMVDALLQEHQHQPLLHKELTQQLVNTLMTVVARNISLHNAEKTTLKTNVTLDIIHYIHLNIYQPEKLKAENIAAHFSISTHYIGEYFKKHTGKNLQQYIISYKLSLVEIRLKHSDMRLNEVADELGFTDESHLTRTFKKHKGMSPAEFRKSQLNVYK